MKIKHLLWTAILTGISLSLSAQTERGQKGMRTHPEARKEIKAYMEKEVFPILAPARAQLDTYIGETEKNHLEEIRSQIKSLKEEGKVLGKSFIKARRQGEYPSQEDIDKMRALGKERRHLMDQAWVIADQYEIEIYEILDQLKLEAEAWKEDMKAIIEKYKPGDAEPQSSRDSKGKGKRGRRKSGNPVRRLLQSPVHFLLWDGSTDVAGQLGEAFELQAFPNPAGSRQSITYRVKNAGKVSIELLDANGQVVRNLEKNIEEAGEYTEEISTRGLKPGVYVYIITTANGTKTKKIKIE